MSSPLPPTLPGADSVESPVRYLAYLSRTIKPLLISGQRYLAYTSDVGEAFRPVVKSYIVKGAYAVSWCYVLGDVGYEGYKAKQQNLPNKEVSLLMVKRATFQSLASMIFPMFTIHTVVKYTAKAVKSNKNAFIRAWAPSAAGLSLLPLLPVVFDHPVEHLVDTVFARFDRKIPRIYPGGDPIVGKIQELQGETKLKKDL